MLKTNLILVLRKLRKDVKYTIMMLVGLVFGFAGTGLIGLYVINELSVDKFHAESSQIYQARHKVGVGEGTRDFSLTPGPLGDALLELPEVAMISRSTRASFKIEVPENQAVFNEFAAMYVDENFFDVFEFSFIQKASEDVLLNPNTVVVTESTAQRYFGRKDVLGEVITIKLGVLNKQLSIEGVVEDFPVNSSIQKNIFISLSTYVKGNVNVEPVMTQWETPFFITYFKTKGKVPLENLQAKFDQISERYYGNVDEQSYAEFKSEGGYWDFPIERFQDQYINGTSPFRNGNRANVYILSIVGVVIISLVFLNFINLWTLKLLRRSKEFGVRKFLGAGVKHIFLIFLLESAFYLIVSALVSLGLAEFFLVQFFNSTLANWAIAFTQFPYLVWLLIGVLTLFIMGMSIYPSLAFRKVRVIESLKGSLNKGKRASGLRNLLLGGQLTITLSFMIVLYFMNKQVDHLMNRDLGWDAENLIVIQDPFYAIYENKRDFRLLLTGLEEVPGVEAVVSSSVNPGRGLADVLISKRNSSDLINVKLAAYKGSFFKTFGIDFIEGRGITDNQSEQKNEVVINQTASIKYDIKTGDLIKWYGQEVRVVGISRDILVPPFSLSEQPVLFGNTSYPSRSYYLKIAANDPSGVLANVENVWRDFMGTAPFEYHYIQEDINQSLAGEQELSKLISYFSLFAMIISSLGVLAITGFVCQLRIKEVGIRKVLGAAYQNIYRVISSGFYLTLLFAFLVAVPISILLANNWLNNYTDRVSIEPVSILVIGLINLVLITLIVLSNSIKTMRVNPAKILRDD